MKLLKLLLFLGLVLSFSVFGSCGGLKQTELREEDPSSDLGRDDSAVFSEREAEKKIVDSIERSKEKDQSERLVPEKKVEPVPEVAVEQKKKLAFGLVCVAKSDCEKGLLCKDPGSLGANVCTRTCHTKKLPCKKDEICEQHDDKLGYCVPTCKKHKDCSPFKKSMPACNIEKHCWRSWQTLGDQCVASEECLSQLCGDPGGLGFEICTKICLKSSECGSEGFCRILKGAKKGFCTRACSDKSDCENKTPSLPVCKDKKHCWMVE